MSLSYLCPVDQLVEQTQLLGGNLSQTDPESEVLPAAGGASVRALSLDVLHRWSQSFTHFLPFLLRQACRAHL